MEVVAPSSVPMLVMVARSGTDRVLTPAPPYSMTLPTPPLTDRMPQHLQDDVLGGDPGAQLAGQIDLDDLGHGDVVGAAAHGHGHVHAARAEGQHADAAAGGGVAVGADEGLAGYAEALQMHLMADAVAGAGELDAVLCGNGSG